MSLYRDVPSKTPEVRIQWLKTAQYTLLHAKWGDWRYPSVKSHAPGMQFSHLSSYTTSENCSEPSTKLHLTQVIQREENTAVKSQSWKICPVFTLPYCTCTRPPFLIKWSLQHLQAEKLKDLHSDHSFPMALANNFSKFLILDILTFRFWQH